MAHTTIHENAKGKYTYKRTKVTRNYFIVEKRYLGETRTHYLLSSGKNIKSGSYRNIGDAYNEAIRRQEYIDSRN